MGESQIHEFTIQGMSCTGCSNRIEKVLSQTPGVERAVVNFAGHSAVVQSSLSTSDIEKIIDDLGFSAYTLGGALSREELLKQEQAEARTRLVWAMILGLPVIALGMIHSLADVLWVRIASALATGLLLVGPGRIFFINAIRNLKHKAANMDTLVALGAGLTYIWSLYQAFSGQGYVYFETAAAIVAFVLIGKFVEQRMTWRATSSLGALLQLQPRTAQRISRTNQNKVEEIDLRFLRPGDILRVRVGERFAADGVVLDGASESDESLLTGESLPVAKTPGADVVAGALNLTAPLVYEAKSIGSESRLGEIVAFVERTQLSKAPVQKLVDKVSSVFVPGILSLSLLTYLFWIFALRSEQIVALNAAVSVLVVACPCALGLATPIAVAIATHRAARMGLFFRDVAAFEALHSVDTLVLDKTGTLTEGKFKIVHEHQFETLLPRELILSIVSSLEKISQHPIAAAVVNWIEMKNLPARNDFFLTQLREIAGEGVRARLSWREKEYEIRVGKPDARVLSELPAVDSATWILCSLDDHPQIAFALSDSLRPAAHELLDSLKSMGIEPVLASGDRNQVVQEFGRLLGIASRGEQSPEMKAEYIFQLQGQGKRVAMVGDGVNDAPALARADVGIAMGSGTHAAQQTAAVTLRDVSLSNIITALRLSKATFRNIAQNLAWAFGYNILLIPLAMSGRLTPMWAAAAMAFSSVFVVLNALRLLRFGNRAQ
jgi:Cu+-exporting ATPase